MSGVHYLFNVTAGGACYQCIRVKKDVVMSKLRKKHQNYRNIAIVLVLFASINITMKVFGLYKMSVSSSYMELLGKKLAFYGFPVLLLLFCLVFL
jgi:hypothetical protein